DGEYGRVASCILPGLLKNPSHLRRRFVTAAGNRAVPGGGTGQAGFRRRRPVILRPAPGGPREHRSLPQRNRRVPVALRRGRAADVMAEGTVECLAITKAPLQEFLKAHPKVAGFLTEILGKRLLTNEGIRHVGKYKLIGELGRGGMAIVYEGLHPTLSRTVAI